jgi:hypothetical protein
MGIAVLALLAAAAGSALKRASCRSNRVRGVAPASGGYRVSRGVALCLETEQAQILAPPLRVADDAGASQALCIEVPEGAGTPPETEGTGVLAFAVAVPGEYRLWGRAWWSDSCGNSFTVAMDDGAHAVLGQDATYGRWHWVRGGVYVLARGPHTLTIANREDGARLDQVFLSQDDAYVPNGMETAWGTQGSMPPSATQQTARAPG